MDYTVANVGSEDAGPFDVQALLDPNQSVVVDRAFSGLPAGADQTVTISTPPGGNCFDPDCSITVTADSNAAVRECDENNNALSETTGG